MASPVFIHIACDLALGSDGQPIISYSPTEHRTMSLMNGGALRQIFLEGAAVGVNFGKRMSPVALRVAEQLP